MVFLLVSSNKAFNWNLLEVKNPTDCLPYYFHFLYEVELVPWTHFEWKDVLFYFINEPVSFTRSVYGGFTAAFKSF